MCDGVNCEHWGPTIEGCEAFESNKVFCMAALDCADGCANPCPKCLAHYRHGRILERYASRGYNVMIKEDHQGATILEIERSKHHA